MALHALNFLSLDLHVNIRYLTLIYRKMVYNSHVRWNRTKNNKKTRQLTIYDVTKCEIVKLYLWMYVVEFLVLF